MIEIDGSYGEGGGQILRMSVALSALTGKEVAIKNIRANRPNPGLRRQHITAIESVRKICNGDAEGLEEGSMSVTFRPGKIEGGKHVLDIGTAGSVTLVLQACLLPSLFAEDDVDIIIRGGTDVKWAPPWDYFRHVFLPLIGKMGAEVEGKIYRRGYYPRGGGEVEINVKPCSSLRPLKFGNGEGEAKKIEFEIGGRVNISSLPLHIAERIKDTAERQFRSRGMSAEIEVEKAESLSQGTGIVLWASEKGEGENAGGRRLLGADCLGERGKPAEKVGKEAALFLINEIEAGADIDIRAVDQLLPYMALAENSSFKCRKVSNHAETEMWLLEKFLGVKFERKKEGMLESVKVLKGNGDKWLLAKLTDT